ncbi:MAG TPA: carboxypeptidase regulatory-like domain-containing protein [Pyrinomonadaceae bacterium]|nr:carboxypeptidase regulatory-like domain-containing protein [Pyrinomonadaceae bacterium]
MQSSRKITQLLALIIFALSCVFAAHAQVTTGSIRGVVTDPNGAVVPNAQVTLTKKSTNTSSTVQTSGSGQFEFPNLLVGEDYEVKIEAPNFKTLTLTDVRVNLNQITDLPAQLTLGQVGETVVVTSGGTELVDTTTTNLSKSFSTRQVVELAQTNVGGAFGGGVNNLALIAPNVSSSGGVGVGSGGSVGGQRPRNNNFVIDGVDNNDKSVTGPAVYVSPEVVQEFSLLQNQFSAEFARSTGGQFVTVTKSGTNEYHGTGYGFIRNRFLNALDTRQIEDGFVRERNVPGTQFLPRFDFFRGGANLGGPIIAPRFGESGPSLWRGKNKLFFFTSYERLQVGFGAAPAGITALTAGSLATVSATPGVSANNLAVYRQFVPIAATGNGGTINFCSIRPDLNGNCQGAVIPLAVGTIELPPQPQFNKQNNFVVNIDFTQSSRTQHRARYNWTDNYGVALAGLPIFNEPVPAKQRLFSYTLLHTFTSNLTNETRLAYRRTDNSFPVTTPFRFPGLTDTTFPNLGLLDLGVDIGPPGNNPQTGIENNYQVVNNVSYLMGNHSFKFGGDFRQVISPQTFTQRSRGDYQYSEAQFYFYDLAADNPAQRSVGDVVYYGTQKILYAFAQDDWRIRPNLTLNLGVSYSYQEPPKGTQLQALNAISNVPGLIEFHAPVAQKKNFGPKVGFAWSPDYKDGILGRVFGSGGRSSLRAGFSMSYDYIFDNLYILSLPPQAQQTVDLSGPPYTPNFLASGGIPNVLAPAGTNAAAARAATSAWIDDQQVPYSLTWTGSYQRQMGENWVFEARYLGTRGIHLLTQNRINRQNKAGGGFSGLPTFLSAPSQAQLDALPLTLTAINARSNFVPAFANAGFTNPGSIVGFLSNGSSSYHGASAQLIHRFSDGLQMTAAYTWSHLIDDTTAEVNTTVLSPRRVQDFQNIRADRADSALDRRHRFVTSFIYELPFFNKGNGLTRTLLGGFNFSGTYTAESGERATVLSGIDSNLNGDAAADRTIINPAGVPGTGSTVTALTNSAGQIVGYLADNPNAQYIRAGLGAIATSARNTLQLPGINNIDFSVFKNFRLGETRRIQLRADLFNALNHPQYIPGSTNDIQPVTSLTVGQVNTVTAATISLANPAAATFNRPDRVFLSGPRVIQLALRFDF